MASESLTVKGYLLFLDLFSLLFSLTLLRFSLPRCTKLSVCICTLEHTLISSPAASCSPWPLPHNSFFFFYFFRWTGSKGDEDISTPPVLSFNVLMVADTPADFVDFCLHFVVLGSLSRIHMSALHPLPLLLFLFSHCERVR